MIEECQSMIELADYTFQGKQPSEVHLTHFDHSIKIVMVYKVEDQSPVRVVLFGEEKEGNLGVSGSYTLKIVDLTTL